MDKRIKTIFSILVFFSLPLICRAGDLPAWHGFVENIYGFKLHKKPQTKHESYNVLEQRLQLKTRYSFQGDDIFSKWSSILAFKGEFVLDEYFQTTAIFDLRELNLSLRPLDMVDIKVGRQVLTWGTGDYLFINDLFPKDYVSFYIGRDDEYLKKPSDALRILFYPQFLSFDFIVIPRFTPNTIADGERLSFFDTFKGKISGRESERNAVKPSRQANNTQYALRLYKNIEDKELALYYLRVFDPFPKSYLDEINHQLFYERLDVYGFSIRGNFLRGIGNLETGYYYSRQDKSGNNRLIENSLFKAMLGYEKDLGNDLKVGIQYQYEQKLKYGNYRDSLLANDFIWDEYYHLLTQSIRKLFKQQTVSVAFFNFYSPSDKDGYVRFSISNDINDHWKITLGANVPWGEDEQSNFAQMKKNKNIYLRLRYSF